MQQIAVIMSTYNGEKYLREQIDSILAQEDVEPLLFIRDDGSTDTTVSIIEEYCSRYPNVVFQNKDTISNIGIKRSFLTLLQWIINSYPDIQFYAYADQDDYWMPKKLVSALEKYDGSEKWIYFSNKEIVDENLELLYVEKLTYYSDILEIFWGSQASGCTMLFSQKLARIVVDHYDSPCELKMIHDSITHRVAHIVGATICFDERAFIRYRQHGSNVVGIEQTTKTSKNWKGLSKKSPHFISELAKKLSVNYQSELSEEGRLYLDYVSRYRYDVIARWRLILNRLALKRGGRMYLIWVGKILLRRL